MQTTRASRQWSAWIGLGSKLLDLSGEEVAFMSQVRDEGIEARVIIMTLKQSLRAWDINAN